MAILMELVGLSCEEIPVVPPSATLEISADRIGVTGLSFRYRIYSITSVVVGILRVSIKFRWVTHAHRQQR